MDLLLRIKGASSDDISRGTAAAEAVLERAGISAEQAAYGAFAIEGWDIRGFHEDEEPPEAAYAAAQLWADAERAAIEACCAGWPEDKKPMTADMGLLTDPEIQLADRATALSKLRAHAEVEDGKSESMNGDDCILAWRVAEELDDVFVARDLVAAVTIAFTTLQLIGFHPDEPIEPKRKAVHDAINALEKATEKQTSH